MSMGKATKIYSKEHPDLALKVTKGHFSSDRFHINYYIDMTDLKMRQCNAEQVAKAIVQKYVKRVNLSPMIGLASEMISQMADTNATKAPIDTIICMDGCEAIGAYVAKELSDVGIATTNTQDVYKRQINGSRPYCSICSLPSKPSIFSTSSSTGSPWVSHPAFLLSLIHI